MSVGAAYGKATRKTGRADYAYWNNLWAHEWEGAVGVPAAHESFRSQEMTRWLVAGFTIAQNSGAIARAVESCQSSSGANTVGLIHDAMLTNPENIDLVPTIIECLNVNHLVSQGYNRSDYLRRLPQFTDGLEN